MSVSAEVRPLPPPRLDGAVSVEHALRMRRSLRQFSNTPLTLAEAAQVLWSAQGITQEHKRTAPSAGSLYPLELYLVAGQVLGLDAGLFHYAADDHMLRHQLEGDFRRPLAQAALQQRWVEEAAAVLVFTAVERRTTYKYGDRGRRYIHIEIGHAAQNAFLQATALDLGAVVIGAFEDDEVRAQLRLPRELQPLYLMALGRP